MILKKLILIILVLLFTIGVAIADDTETTCKYVKTQMVEIMNKSKLIHKIYYTDYYVNPITWYFIGSEYQSKMAKFFATYSYCVVGKNEARVFSITNRKLLYDFSRIKTQNK